MAATQACLKIVESGKCDHANVGHMRAARDEQIPQGFGGGDVHHAVAGDLFAVSVSTRRRPWVCAATRSHTRNAGGRVSTRERACDGAAKVPAPAMPKQHPRG